MPRKSPYTILLDQDEKRHLQAIARKYTSPYRDVMRAKVILLAAEGLSNKQIGARLELPRQIVSAHKIGKAAWMDRVEHTTPRTNHRIADVVHRDLWCNADLIRIAPSIQ